MAAVREDQLSVLQLQSLMRVTSAVNSTLHLDELFDLILSETVSAITHADGGVLFLYEESRNGLVSKASLNYINEQGIERICISPGESITGQCFLDKKPILLRTKEEVQEAMDTISGRNRMLFKHAVSEHQEGFAYRVISVPLLLANERCMGVLTINGFRSEGDFNEDDVRLLQAIASQAVMALEKATLYKDVHDRNHELAQMLKFHEEMTESLMKVGHHQAIVDKISEKISCPVSMITVNGELLHSNSYREDEKISPVEFPIRNAHETLGILKVYHQQGSTLTTFQRFMIQQTCVFLALEIHREEKVREMEHRLKVDLLDDLLDGAFSSELVQKAKALGFKTTGRLLAVVGEMDSIHKDDSEDIHQYMNRYLLKREMSRWIKKEVDLVFPGSLVINKNERFVLLLSYPKTALRGELYTKTKGFAAKINAAMQNQHGLTLSFGISRSVSDFSELYQALEDANKVMQYIRSHQQTSQILEFASLGYHRLLVQNGKEEMKEFVHSVLGELIEYDQKRQGDYLQTLITYVNCSRHVGNTAKSLHIHVNTLHYRINRIEELLSVSLSNASQFLNVHLACELYSQLGET
jgi:sugar diacid utilization regulator